MAKAKFAFRALLSLGLLLWVTRKINWSDLGVVLGRIDWSWAALGFLLSGTLISGLALRWQIFLRQQKIDLPFGTVLSLTWAGQFFNSFLPGSTGGDLVKIYEVCRLHAGRSAAAITSVILDRLSALVVLLIFAAVAFFLEPIPLSELLSGRISTISLWWLGAIMTLAVVVVWILARAMLFRPRLNKLQQTVAGAVRNLRPNTAVAVLLALVIHSLNFLSLYFLAKSLGLTVSFGQILLIMPVVLLLLMLPITINGHGLREVLFIAYFTRLGVHLGQDHAIAYQEVAVALSLLMVANDLLWSLPGGLQYLVRFRVTKEPHLLASAT
jgi:uncharacterized membrane protein YbhN (UPF0104 family)